MTPFTIHYRVEIWSFTLLPICPFPSYLHSLPSIYTLLILISYIDWIALCNRYGQKNGFSFGLYERDTHTILTIPDCSINHPSINLAVEFLTVATADAQADPYDEDTGNGGLRYVQLQVEIYTGRICLYMDFPKKGE